MSKLLSLNNSLKTYFCRFADVRNTIQGKQEERLPFFSFSLPKWFQDKYPGAYLNLKGNAPMLTTPFDVHRTLEHILDFHYIEYADIRHRDVSLFSQVRCLT